MKASDVLNAWGYKYHHATLIDKDYEELEEIPLREAGKYVDVVGNFGENCTVILNTKEFQGDEKTTLTFWGNDVPQHVKICLLKPAPMVRLYSGGGNCNIFVGNYRFRLNADIETWNNSSVFIGDRVACGGARFLLSNSRIIIGCDSLLSEEIILQSTDSHGIVDLATMTIINNRHREIRIGKHVWIGRRVTLLPDCSIGDGTIIGLGSVVTGQLDGSSLCAGVPARIIKRNMSWSRRPDEIKKDEEEILRQLQENLF